MGHPNGELTFPISSIVKGGEKLSIRRAVVYLVKDERLVVLVSVVFDLRETLKVAKLKILQNKGRLVKLTVSNTAAG